MWGIDEDGSSNSRALSPPGRKAKFMPADALKCKECKTEYALEARYVCERCFGPLEVAYSAPTADPEELRRRI